MNGNAEFVITAITSDPVAASALDDAGVDRIGIDIERIGKFDRQRHIPEARISAHELEDLPAVAKAVRHAQLFVRVNPLHDGSRVEVEQALALGARVLMLPYFRGRREAAAFVEMVGGRAAAVLLLETASAVECLPEIVTVPGLSEITVGLNDLHISLGLSNPFDAVVSGLMMEISERVRGAGLRFGFGGLARFDDGTLPVPADLVYAQYPRLGATSAWLARSFFAGLGPGGIGNAVRDLRQRMGYWAAQPSATLERRREELAEVLEDLACRRT